jgi:hypothetical protein
VPTATASTPIARASIAPRANRNGTDATVDPATGPGRSVSSPSKDPARPVTPTTRSISRPKETGSTAPERASPSSTVARRFVDALPAVHTNGSTGSIVPVLIGAGLLLLLGGGTAGALWRRRQHE